MFLMYLKLGSLIICLKVYAMSVCYIFFFFASHATLGLYKKLNNRAPKALNRYFNYSINIIKLFCMPWNFILFLRKWWFASTCVKVEIICHLASAPMSFRSFVLPIVCRWEMCGQIKVVLKIESEEDMLILQVKKIFIISYFELSNCDKMYYKLWKFSWIWCNADQWR